MDIRKATRDDDEPVWRILEPMIRAGETYPLPRDMGRDAALEHWFGGDHEAFLAEEDGIVGTYYLRPNQGAAGSHVANCGYVTTPWAAGRGVARAMCAHSFEAAKARGFRAMQFNLVVSSNLRAVRLWQFMGMEIVGRLPGAFQHPTLGDVDAYVMYRKL